MNQLLMERFDSLVEGPESIQSLRRFIVNLAICDKLVEHDANEESSADLLKRITELKLKLIADKQLRKSKPLPPIEADEIPDGFPKCDTLVRLSDIATIEKGETGIKKAIPGPFPLVVTAKARATSDTFQFDCAAAIVPLVSSTGHGHASINRLHYEEGKFAIGSILCAVVPFSSELVSARFIFEYLTAYKEELLVSQMLGTANVTLTVGKISAVPIPIMRPKSQAKVDELMVLCDRLEAAQAERNDQRNRLVAATHHQINLPDGKADTTDAHTTDIASFLFHPSTFKLHTSRPQDVSLLRQTILNLAVRGKLVPQDPNDEPASSLQPIPTQDITEGFKLPTSWKWVELRQVGTGSTGKTPPTKDPSNFDGKIPFVGPGQITKTGDILPSPKSLTEDGMLLSTEALEGDVLMVCIGGSIGKAALSKERLAFNQQINAIRPILVTSEFAYIVLSSPHFQTLVLEKATGTATPIINRRKWESIQFPLPPLAEQKRIVAKVTELMALCDTLEAQLTTSQSESQQLLEACLNEAIS